MSETEELLFKAASVKSFQELIDYINNITSLEMVVADSLHYILGLSKNISENLGDDISWIDLINEGYAPPVRENAPEQLEHKIRPSNRSESINKNLTIHYDLETSSDRFSTMCDIMDGERTVLKLLITYDSSLNEEEKKLVIAICGVLYILYFRLGAVSFANTKKHYFLERLLRGDADLNSMESLNRFDTQGPFYLLSFDISHLASHNLAYLFAFSKALNAEGTVSGTVANYNVILTNVNSAFAAMIPELNAFANEHKFVIALSDAFTDLKNVRNYYIKTVHMAETASRFLNAKGIFRWEDLSIFISFDELAKRPSSGIFLNDEVLTPVRYDEEKNTDFVETLFCYLLHNCEAPATSEALFIHRNTLDKRIRKIETLIKGDWRNPAYRFSLLFSLYDYLSNKEKLTFYR